MLGDLTGNPVVQGHRQAGGEQLSPGQVTPVEGGEAKEAVARVQGEGKGMERRKEEA